MSVQNTNSPVGQHAAVDGVAKPLTQLTKAQKQKVTSELLRIHDLVSNLPEDQVARKDKCDDKADRACSLDFKPGAP